MGTRGPKPRPFTREVVEALLRRRSEQRGECLEWTGANSGGYGQAWFGGRLWVTSRLGWFLKTDVLPPADRDVLHTCDNPPCWSPEHLYLGEAPDNGADAVLRERHAGPTVEEMQRGSQLPFAKLDEAKVSAMRLQRAAGISLREIAEQYGIALSTASNAIRGVNWQHVDTQAGTSQNAGPRQRRDQRDPEISIQRSGRLSLNGPAYVALGSPIAVSLLTEAGTVCVTQPIKSEHAYSVHPYVTSRTYVIYARAFLTKAGINTDRAARYRAAVISGGLVIDLGAPPLTVGDNLPPQRMRKPHGRLTRSHRTSTAVCTTDGCPTIAKARGLCAKHYQQLRAQETGEWSSVRWRRKQRLSGSATAKP